MISWYSMWLKFGKSMVFRNHKYRFDDGPIDGTLMGCLARVRAAALAGVKFVLKPVKRIVSGRPKLCRAASAGANAAISAEVANESAVDQHDDTNDESEPHSKIPESEYEKAFEKSKRSFPQFILHPVPYSCSHWLWYVHTYLICSNYESSGPIP